MNDALHAGRMGRDVDRAAGEIDALFDGARPAFAGIAVEHLPRGVIGRRDHRADLVAHRRPGGAHVAAVEPDADFLGPVVDAEEQDLHQPPARCSRNHR